MQRRKRKAVEEGKGGLSGEGQKRKGRAEAERKGRRG
jgi:hypothetical protein